MVITRTPFRISFAGGGSDLAEFYKVKTGAVVSMAIDKYMYICISKNFNKVWKVSYSKTEYASSISQIEHPIVRETLRNMDIKEPLDIVSISDMPAGSGLGTSSAYTVGLLNALFAYQGKKISKEELAQSACNIEIDLVKEPIGKQDQYASAYGGLNYIQFNKDDSVIVEPITYNFPLTDYLLLLFTEDTRQAGQILKQVKEQMPSKMWKLFQLKDTAAELRLQMQHNLPPYFVAAAINENWLIKKEMATCISNQKIDSIISKGLVNGADGAKLLGAGAEGFVLFFCRPSRQESLVRSFDGKGFTWFQIDKEGSKVIYND